MIENRNSIIIKIKGGSAMYFLDELDNYRLYRRSVLLPIDEKNKKHNCAAFLLSPNIEGTKDIFRNSLLVNRYYNAFYTERAVLYYVNQENVIEEIVGDFVSDTVSLYDDSNIQIQFNGYDHNISDVKSVLTKKWFKSKIDEFKINPKKIKEIPITILESRKDSTGNMIYVVPKYRYPKEFKSYENFCYFNALVWLFNQANPEINDWLCYALALKESGVSSLYAKREWPFHYNLGIICRSLDLFEENNSRAAYISELIKGYNGLAKLEIRIDDMFSLLGKELGSSLKKSFYENSMPISDTTDIIFEDSSYNPLFKKTLMKNRIKTAKELKEFYDKIKDEFSDIKYTYNDINLYNRLNLFVDLSYYSNSFLLNTTTTKIKGAKAYLELVKRLLNDKRFEESYTKQTVIIPVNSWAKITNDDENMHLIGKHINPISCIFWCLSSNTGINLKDIFGDREVLFLGDSSFMKINFSKLDKLNNTLFLRNIRMIIKNSMVLDPEAKIGTKATSSARAIKMSIVDNIEKSAKIKIDDISGEEPVGKNTTEEEDKKTAIVQTVKAATANQNNEDDAIDSIDQNKEDAERIKKLMSDLATNPDDRGSNISGARASRMLKLQNDFLDSEFEGKSMREIIKSNETESEAEVVKTVKLDIDSVNPEWKDMKFAATMGSYKLDNDIVRIFGSFYDKSNPLVVRELNKEDTSTSDDLIETYTCKYESAKGERFTLKLDIPKFVDNQYMILRGNRKNIPIQLLLMPILKTEENAVQIVSCYNKIFVRRFGTNSGKSNPVTDKLMKALDKEYKHIKTETGDNSKVCSKYELPIDYIDLASNYSKIETPRYTFLFNQDYIRSKYKIDDKNGLCFGIDKKTKEPIYFKPNPDQPIFFSYYLQIMIETSLANTNERELFIDNFNSAATAVRYCYSRASILGTNIPLVVICGLAEGLEKTMQKAKIKYSLSEARPKYDKATQDIIKFNDGYLLYNLDYSSCLLMNGLKQCATEEHSLTEINSRLMYLDFLDMFGGRIKADGLDNFQDCMVDPITREVLQHYKLPTDYVSILLYANFLLSDNKFTKHGDIRSTRRMRRMEQVASYMYEVLSKAYGAYSTGLKHGRNVGFSVKQSAVIDRLLVGNTTDDQSILNALGEYEAYYAVTPKGPSGMNSDRAYSLDKRSFDDSMVNVLSASTGFAGNVGISRQATIDANIEGSRGYIYNDPDMENGEINSVKTLCMTESLTPFTTTRDDPMRLAMGFIQTSKHGMRCNHSDPALITSGADEALPYLISNTFAYKAKENGKVVEIVPDEYMIIEYDKPVDGKSHEYIDLSESVQKNSSSGFYVTLKLDTELKEGKRFKAGDIVAYDKQSFSDEMGADDNIAYNIGTLAKFAILNTDEGFEDSAIISNSGKRNHNT